MAGLINARSVRVLTIGQVREGYGLDAQAADIRAWARGDHHRIMLWCSDEGISGANGVDSRKGLYEALQALQDGRVCGIVFTSLDRERIRQALANVVRLVTPDGAVYTAAHPMPDAHSLRYFAASGMLAEGVGIMAVAGHLGHSPAMLLSTYSHWMPENLDVPALALDRALSGGLVPALRPAEGLEG